MKVLEITGPDGSADVTPIVTTENLGKQAHMPSCSLRLV